MQFSIVNLVSVHGPPCRHVFFSHSSSVYAFPFRTTPHHTRLPHTHTYPLLFSLPAPLLPNLQSKKCLRKSDESPWSVVVPWVCTLDFSPIRSHSCGKGNPHFPSNTSRVILRRTTTQPLKTPSQSKSTTDTRILVPKL